MTPTTQQTPNNKKKAFTNAAGGNEKQFAESSRASKKMSGDKAILGKASFLSSTMDEVKYPSRGDFVFAKIAMEKELDAVAKRAETLIREKYLAPAKGQQRNNNDDENNDDDDARTERVFETLVAKNDEQCDKIDEHIMQARGDVTAANEKLSKSTRNDASMGGKKNNYNSAAATTSFRGGGSSVSRPQEAFKDVVDNRTETDLNFVLPPPRGKEKASTSATSKHPLASVLLDSFKFNSIEDYVDAKDNDASDEATAKFWELRCSDPILPTPMNEENPATFVDNEKGLEELEEVLEKASIFAVDLEHHSYRTYRGFTCLIQISTREKDFVVDALSLRHLIGPALGRHFENEEKLKVFHGANSDMIWLQRDFGIYVVNMFDTGQAARILELPSFGLAYLLKQYCGIKAEKKYQLADWRLRPLSREMINYARSDTHSLLYVYDRLKQELYAKGGVECIQSVFLKSRDVCLLTYEPQVITDLSYHEDLMKSANASGGSVVGGGNSNAGHGNTLSRSAQQAQLSQEILKSPVAQASMEALFKWRDECARANDESVGFVMPRFLMLRLASEQPKTARDVVSTARGESSLVAKFSRVIADIIKSAVERGSPVNAAPSAGELFRREHEASMLLKEKEKDESKKDAQNSSIDEAEQERSTPADTKETLTDEKMKKRKKKKAGGMMKTMMMSSSDEDNDDEDNEVHAQAAKEAADRIHAELVSNRQNLFPTYHSIASNGDGVRDGEETENKSKQKGKKRKSRDVLLKSVALRNKDKSERIEIAGGISLPAPIRKKTTQKFGFGLTRDDELVSDEEEDEEDDNRIMNIKDEAMRATAALRKRQKNAMLLSSGGGFSINDDSDADSDAEEEERIKMEKEKQEDFKKLTKGAKSHKEIIEQTEKLLGIKSVHAEIMKGPEMLKKIAEQKRLDAIKGKKGFDGGEWIEPFGKTNLKSRAFPRAGNKQQSFK